MLRGTRVIEVSCGVGDDFSWETWIRANDESKEMPDNAQKNPSDDWKKWKTCCGSVGEEGPVNRNLAVFEMPITEWG